MSDARATAFARVYRAEYATVVRYCQNRVDDGELARDLAAEVFRAAWARWNESRRSDRAWLLGVAHNLVVDEYRRRARRGTALDLDAAQATPDVRAAADFEHADVRRTLASLPPADQELLRLHYWDDLPAADIAAMLAISVGAAWVRLTRARRAFSTAWNGPPTVAPSSATERSAR